MECRLKRPPTFFKTRFKRGTRLFPVRMRQTLPKLERNQWRFRVYKEKCLFSGDYPQWHSNTRERRLSSYCRSLFLTSRAPEQWGGDQLLYYKAFHNWIHFFFSTKYYTFSAKCWPCVHSRNMQTVTVKRKKWVSGIQNDGISTFSRNYCWHLGSLRIFLTVSRNWYYSFRERERNWAV